MSCFGLFPDGVIFLDFCTLNALQVIFPRLDWNYVNFLVKEQLQMIVCKYYCTSEALDVGVIQIRYDRSITGLGWLVSL